MYQIIVAIEEEQEYLEGADVQSEWDPAVHLEQLGS